MVDTLSDWAVEKRVGRPWGCKGPGSGWRGKSRGRRWGLGKCHWMKEGIEGRLDMGDVEKRAGESTVLTGFWSCRVGKSEEICIPAEV